MRSTINTNLGDIMNIQKKLSIAMAISAMAFLPACSTIVNGSNQAVDFNTGEVADASCVVTGGENGAVHKTFTTPATVQLPRSKRMINVACTKAGYQNAAIDVDSKYEASTAGNVLAGGFIGLGIDAATGALYKYPDTIQIPMVSLNGNVEHTAK